MPGGRLTHADRQSISDWLTEGLNYAEIARRLDRPTSTITREITRNSGPGHGYRPDLAERATRQRARRRKPPRSAATPAATDSSGRSVETVREFENRLTEVLVLNAFPRMMARVLACLYTTDTGSLTAAELTQRLQVSPASISAAVRNLEEQGLISRERDPRRRRDRYVIDEDVWYRAMIASARTNSLLADTVRDGAEILGKNTPAGARLEDTSHFLERVYDELIRAAEHWREVYIARHNSRTHTPEDDTPPESW